MHCQRSAETRDISASIINRYQRSQHRHKVSARKQRVTNLSVRNANCRIETRDSSSADQVTGLRSSQRTNKMSVRKISTLRKQRQRRERTRASNQEIGLLCSQHTNKVSEQMNLHCKHIAETRDNSSVDQIIGLQRSQHTNKMSVRKISALRKQRQRREITRASNQEIGLLCSQHTK